MPQSNVKSVFETADRWKEEAIGLWQVLVSADNSIEIDWDLTAGQLHRRYNTPVRLSWQAFAQHLPPGTAATLLAQIWHCLETQNTFELSYTYQTKPDEFDTFIVKGYVVRPADCKAQQPQLLGLCRCLSSPTTITTAGGRQALQENQLFFDAPIGMLVSDRYSIVCANNIALHLLGVYTIRELSGQPIYQICTVIQPDGRTGAEVLDNFFDAIEQTGSARIDLQCIRRNGGTWDARLESFIFNFNLPSANREGYFIFSIQDVTAEKRALRSLIETRHFFQNLLDSAQDLVIAVDTRFHITHLNERMREVMAEYQVSIWVGQPVTELWAATQQFSITHWQEAMRSNYTTVEWEVFNVHRQQVQFWELSFYPIFELSNNISGAVCFGRNIDLRKKSESLISKKNRELLAHLEALELAYKNLDEEIQRNEFFLNILPLPHFITMVPEGLQYCNDAGLKLFGFQSLAEMQAYENSGGEFQPEFQPDGQKSTVKAAKIVAAALNQANKTTFEWQHRRKDGSVFDAEVTIALFTYQGKTYTHSIIQDISERKRNEAYIQAQNQQLEMSRNEILAAYRLAESQRLQIEAIINSTDDLIYVYDSNYKLVYFNRANYRVWQRMGINLTIGMNIAEVVSSEEWKIIKSDIDTVLRGEKVRRYSRYFNQDGKVSDYLISCNPIYDTQGQIIGMVGYDRDITEQHYYEEILKQKNEELEAQQEQLRQSLEEVEKTAAQLIIARQQAELRRSEIESIINATEDYIIALDNKLRINYFNQAGYTLLKSAGKTPVCGDAIDAFKEHAFFQEIVKKTAAVVAEKKSVRFEFSLSFKPQNILLYVSINPIIQKEYQLGGVVVIAREITAANIQQTQ